MATSQACEGTSSWREFLRCLLPRACEALPRWRNPTSLTLVPSSPNRHRSGSFATDAMPASVIAVLIKYSCPRRFKAVKCFKPSSQRCFVQVQAFELLKPREGRP